jgi:hypothetical protein
VAGAVAALALPFVAYNFISDDFGLFWSQAPRRIWFQEKTSKYLMSFRYIPRHFDGLLIGSSYSDGSLNTRRLRGYRIYNLSMEGGNATELRAAAVNAIDQGRMRLLIICLGPYITKNSGFKGDEISAKEYWGSLFSLLPLKLAAAKFRVRWSGEPDLWADSEWGSADLPRRKYPWNEFIQVAEREPVESEIRIDPTAQRDLAAIIAAAHRAGVRILAYFYPYNIWSVETAIDSGDWGDYRARTLALFDRRIDIVWDMMGPRYDSFRRDVACYSDGHLSAAGMNLVIEDIQAHIDLIRAARATAPVAALPDHFPCLGTAGAGSGFDRSPTVASGFARPPG